MAQGTLLNQSVGSYRLIDFIGAGGMGEVYRGIDSAHNRLVALKVLNVTKTAPNAVERFRNEARIHGAVRHPNIATMYEYLEFAGAPCIAMEYIDGETIDERIRTRGALTLKQGLEIFERIVDAVGYLHSRGIIHRDIKSNNVKIAESGTVKVLDFGIAKSADSPRLTVSGAMVGTPQYVSPEQLRGEPADERTDIWALGVLLYEMLTGRLPFEGGSMAAVVDRVGKASYPAPSRVNPSLPREIDRIVGLCLKGKPDQRYQSAEALLTDLRAQHEEAPRTTPPSSWSLARLRSSGEMRAAAARRLPAIAAMGAAALAFVFLMYALFSKPGPNVVTPGADTAIVSVTPVPAGNGKETSATAQRPSGAIREIVLTLSEGRAEVYSDTGFVGFTPHVVKAALGDHVSLVLRRNGYEDEPVNFIVTEALVPRFTYSLRPRLSPPGSGAYQPFASRTLPRQTSLVQIPFYG
ncbi:MAG TPA: serine/threonine-protein kinase [Gemmatimonadaceae bacterium]|jgi:serine/threonine-protein kinase